MRGERWKCVGLEGERCGVVVGRKVLLGPGGVRQAHSAGVMRKGLKVAAVGLSLARGGMAG